MSFFFGVSNPFSYPPLKLKWTFCSDSKWRRPPTTNTALPPIRNWALQHRARQSYSWHEPGLESRPTKTTRDIQVVERRLQIPWIHYWRDCITEQRASHLSLTESSSYGGEHLQWRTVHGRDAFNADFIPAVAIITSVTRKQLSALNGRTSCLLWLES